MTCLNSKTRKLITIVQKVILCRCECTKNKIMIYLYILYIIVLILDLKKKRVCCSNKIAFYPMSSSKGKLVMFGRYFDDIFFFKSLTPFENSLYLTLY